MPSLTTNRPRHRLQIGPESAGLESLRGELLDEISALTDLQQRELARNKEAEVDETELRRRKRRIDALVMELGGGRMPVAVRPVIPQKGAIAVRKWLDENERSVRWLARHVGLRGHQHLSYVLDGERTPSDDLVRQLQRVTGLPLEWLQPARSASDGSAVAS